MGPDKELTIFNEIETDIAKVVDDAEGSLLASQPGRAALKLSCPLMFQFKTHRGDQALGRGCASEPQNLRGATTSTG